MKIPTFLSQMTFPRACGLSSWVAVATATTGIASNQPLALVLSVIFLGLVLAILSLALVKETP
jgi:hypothetical protein